MVAQQFYQKIENEMDNEITKQKEKEEKNKKAIQSDEEKINKILENISKLEKNVSIIVPSLSKAQIAIDEDNLNQEMTQTMVLQSNIIQDIYSMKNIQEQMKVMLNTVVGILHHTLRFKNNFKLKNSKELDTYIAKEPAYNQINIRIKMLQNLIDKSTENCGMLKQKIGFIRDLTKKKTQEMYNEKGER